MNERLTKQTLLAIYFREVASGEPVDVVDYLRRIRAFSFGEETKPREDTAALGELIKAFNKSQTQVSSDALGVRIANQVVATTFIESDKQGERLERTAKKSITTKFRDGMLATPRRLDVQLSYEAPELAAASAIAERLREALKESGLFLKPDENIPHGLTHYNTDVTTQIANYMPNADKAIIARPLGFWSPYFEADVLQALASVNDPAHPPLGNTPFEESMLNFLKPHFEKEAPESWAPYFDSDVLIEWGPGDGQHAKDLIEQYIKHFGRAPKMYIGIDRSPQNLKVTEEKVAHLVERCVMLNNNFYDDPLLWRHPVWREIRQRGLSTTNFIFGGTPFNVREEKRVPFLEQMRAAVDFEPTKGSHRLVVTTDWSTDRDAITKAYKLLSPFYRLGLNYGCLLASWRPLTNFKDHIHFDEFGIVTQLVSTTLQHIVSDYRFTLGDLLPRRRFDTIQKGEAINCTIAEKNREHIQNGFRKSGWEFIPGQNPELQTLPFKDPDNPTARVGWSVYKLAT